VLYRFLFCASFWTTTARSQIPFYTDDADTTAKGKFHLEIYNEHDVLQKSSYPAKRQNTLVFTVNYGLTNKLEFGVNPPLTFGLLGGRFSASPRAGVHLGFAVDF